MNRQSSMQLKKNDEHATIFQLSALFNMNINVLYLSRIHYNKLVISINQIITLLLI